MKGAPGSRPAIALLPLDDRPCNRLFPQQLARIIDCDLLLPPRELLGWFTTPGDCEGLAGWLCDCPADRLVVSADMLCYGGLVAGRTSAATLEQASGLLEAVRLRKRQRPGSVIYAFSNVMRLGATVTSEETLRLHSQLVLYSMLWDRVHRLGEEQARGELAEVAERLDPTLLDQYLAIRERNHAVNLRAARLVADGAIDYLVLCQEDAAAVGLHVPEQQALREEIARLGVGDHVSLHPGSDEVGVVLMARHLADHAGHSPLIAVDYATEAGAATTPLYEHQPLRETVASQVRAAGARLSTPGEAEAIMFVHTPLGRQAEASEAPPQGQAFSHALQADRVAERAQAARAAGMLVGVADVAYANGADPELIAALRRYEVVKDLYAFAAWNTAGNTVGTVAAHLCLEALARRAGRRGATASGEFVACRLLDDWAYQSLVRRQAMRRAESLGANPYALGEAAEHLEAYVRAELEPFAHEIHSLGFAAGGAEGSGFHVRLPWKRLFEIEVDVISLSS